jgi:hypothetical protein
VKSLRELEKQLETLESKAESGALYMTLDDGRHIKINCGSPDGVLNLLSSSIKNEDFPYRTYIEHAVSGVPEQGAFVMTCKAILESIERIEAEKAGV